MKFIIIIIFFQPLVGLSQKAFIEKINKDDKAHLAVVIMNKDDPKRYFASCFFKDVTLLPDTVKISLIEELFKYLDDTIMCYRPVSLLSNHYTGRMTPLTREYNIQIDAMVLINYIAFSSNAFIYSPYPLLFDKVANKEICCNSNDLNIVIEIYKGWFKQLKKSGLDGYCYPLYDNKYEWFGSKTKQQKFNQYPIWSNFYDCREMD